MEPCPGAWALGLSRLTAHLNPLPSEAGREQVRTRITMTNDVARRRRTNIDDALDRLARAEDAFLAQQFLAPVLRGRGVRVRVAGVVCALDVEPPDFEGWGVF